jgi:heat shock protein HslJ
MIPLETRPSVLVLVLAVAAFAAIGCGSGGTDAGGSETHAGPPTADQLENGTYSGIYDEPVRLAGGVYEGEPFEPGSPSHPRVTLLGVRAFGDLGDAAGKSAAVLLAENSGGSGTFMYLAVVGMRDGEPVNLGTASFGDRVQVRAMEIVDGAIALDVVRQGAEDGACCPGQLARILWRLRGDRLERVSEEVQGRLSIESLGSDEWVLTALGEDEPAPQSPEVTIAFVEGRVAGTGGCNRYFASIEEGSAGMVTLGPVGSTMMACPDEAMALERTYLERLGKVTQYGYRDGELALSWTDASGHGSLRFAPRGSR